MRWLWIVLMALWVGCAGQPAPSPTASSSPSAGPFVRLVVEGKTHHLEAVEANYSVPAVGGMPSDWSLRAGELTLSGHGDERGGLSTLEGKTLSILKSQWRGQDLGPGELEVGEVEGTVVSGIFRTKLASGSFKTPMVFVAYP